ncbi:MAG: hypothetical protein ACKVQQ_16300 [Burkholderiales bacterium]
MIASPTSLSWLSVFASASTLVCCALPAALVALGAGAAFASLLGAIPQLLWLSEHKEALFAVAAVLLGASGITHWRARAAACPPDAALAEACATTRSGALVLWCVSIALYGLGFAFAFVAPLLL